MGLRNTDQQFGWGMIAIHWLMAVGILGLYPFGLYIVELTYYEPAYKWAPHWHKSIGIILALMLIARLFWRFTNRYPAAPSNHTVLVKLASKLGHLGLYVMMVVVLVSGYLISTEDGRPIDVFGWFSVPAFGPFFDDQADIAGEIHFYVATALIATAVLHAAAALKHHYIDKDVTLTRMLGKAPNKETL